MDIPMQLDIFHVLSDFPSALLLGLSLRWDD
jgi:hypothetical protein